MTLMLTALLIDFAIGWPAMVYQRIKHPVVWIGCFISYLDNVFNRADRSRYTQYATGALTTALVVGLTTITAATISHLLGTSIQGLLAQALVASSLLASRSLYQHVDAVLKPLRAGNLTQARESLSCIVGRDTSAMHDSQVAAAAIESLAENSSDGIYAPLCWGLLFGLPGIAGYKAINTLDSMIGHRTEKYLYFGAFAAKLDDAVNFFPARLSALLISVAGGVVTLMPATAADASRHRSPNAGWPEAAMARALDVRLSGPRTYQNTLTQEPWLNEAAKDAQAADIEKALKVYWKSLTLMVATLVLTTLLV